jgi:tetratricopeptide (TPR) repeat protein
MKLVSTTLTGCNADLIGDALRSVVDWVDACIVIDTGADEATLEVAQKVAGSKLHVCSFAWVHDFAAARNFAFDAALSVKADWCITVDTDERILPNGDDIPKMLAACPAIGVMMRHESNSYMKERCFRLPPEERWRGPTHECVYLRTREILPRARFAEVPKTPEGYRAKFERDVAILKRHTKDHPKDPRWFYYLGDALQNLQQYAAAIDAYTRCAALRGWNEESAWACYRAAECYCILELWQSAIDACADGLARHPGIAELAWLAAYAAWKGGWSDQAVQWAHMSIALGHFAGLSATGVTPPRIGFKNVGALWEGPYDVLRYAYRALGETQRADEAESLYQQATLARHAAHARDVVP